MIVSHDREFVDGLLEKVYEFGGGKVREHLVGIYDYLRAHNSETIQEAIAKGEPSMGASSAKPQQQDASPAATDNASSKKQSYAEHKELQKKIRKAEKAVKDCEQRIATLEKRKKEIDDLLMKPENATNMELVTEYTSLMQKLDEENDNWLVLSEELEEVSGQ